jgi:hypothetical protein
VWRAPLLTARMVELLADALEVTAAARRLRSSSSGIWGGPDPVAAAQWSNYGVGPVLEVSDPVSQVGGRAFRWTGSAVRAR